MFIHHQFISQLFGRFSFGGLAFGRLAQRFPDLQISINLSCSFVRFLYHLFLFLMSIYTSYCEMRFCNLRVQLKRIELRIKCSYRGKIRSCKLPFKLFMEKQ
jgi:hypothetical protein